MSVPDDSQLRGETHVTPAGAGSNGGQGRPDGSPASSAAWALLTITADRMDDAEASRITVENQLRSLEQVKGLGPGTQPYDRLGGQLEALEGLEKMATRDLEWSLRQHPLGAWVKETHGLGEKTMARLLGAIGDPRQYVDRETGEIIERTVAKLWAYCGMHVVDGEAPRLKKGQQSNWNSRARSLIWVVADRLVMQTASPYRKVYDDAKAKYAEAVHDRECMNRSRFNPNGCGTRAHPEWGAVGSPLRDGHKHARARRAVAKAVLKDLWIAAGHGVSE